MYLDAALLAILSRYTTLSTTACNLATRRASQSRDCFSARPTRPHNWSYYSLQRFCIQPNGPLCVILQRLFPRPSPTRT